MTRSKEPRARRQKENPRRESGLGVIFSLSWTLTSLPCGVSFFTISLDQQRRHRRTLIEEEEEEEGQEIRLSQAKLVQKLRNKYLVLWLKVQTEPDAAMQN